MLRRFALAAALLLVGGRFAFAQTTVVYDSITGADGYAYAGSTPRTALGTSINLASPLPDSANLPLQLTGVDLPIAFAATTNYTALRINFFIWGTSSGATSGSTSAYSNLISSFATTTGPVSATANTFRTFNITFSTAVTLPTTTNLGISFVVTANSGSGLVADNNVTGLLSVALQPAVGSNALNISGIPAYYQNLSGLTNGNFLGSDARVGLAAPFILATRLYAVTAVPEAGSLPLVAAAALPLVGMVLQQRRRRLNKTARKLG